jgi:hypothetical protein
MRPALLAPLLPLAAFALATGVAAADRGSHGTFYHVEPAVYPKRVACTTEPAPRTPILKRRPSPRARLRVRVTGSGAYCRATWTADRAAPGSTDVTITATADAGAPSACGTCVVDLLITRLGRGDYTLHLDGATLRAHAP